MTALPVIDKHTKTILDKRTKMKRFKLSEISTVDNPAQEGAKFTIMKRHDEELALFNKWMGEGATIEDDSDTPTLLLKGERRTFFKAEPKAEAVSHVKPNLPTHLGKLTPEENATMLKVLEAMNGELEEIGKGIETLKETRLMTKTDDAARAELIKSAEAFEKHVATIAKRDKCNGTEAMSKARVEHPAEFEAYQSFGDMEHVEPVAKQSSGPHAFEKAVNAIKLRDNCSDTAAMTKARQENPDEFADYQQAN